VFSVKSEKIIVKDLIVHSFEVDLRKRFFQFAKTLPDKDFWGKKGRYLRGNFERFQEFLDYIKPFEPKCFLVAIENGRLVGFIVAVYNPSWVAELEERYGHEVEKRAYILGMAVVQRRIDVLKVLTHEMMNYFSREGIRIAEYPTLGNVCLTTGTDVLTSENVDSLILFREAGFKVSECYYSMKLDLDAYRPERCSANERMFRFENGKIEIFKRNRVLGRVTWDPIKNGKTDIGIYVEPAYRGKGFGTVLMAKALEKLKTDGVKVIELGVDGNNLSALRLYRKFGFTVFKTHFYILICSRTLNV
jgi:RimJ/RimL family protein N-acetyltransferase